MKLEYDPEADAAYFEIATSDVAETKELEPGIFGDYDDEGHLVGLEVIAVSKRASSATLKEVA
ncbi:MULTISPECIES: DUF2283 domain-containing protein [Thiorhodovibrio]|uniref:DUF2283 domain-containing protein n=1 Tax=Thiorhodovibrio TaxID=61593 RepID=UPI001911D48D|nr:MULTISPECIES: DUF2283 domain-containing protein [Thiorhodovibrio]MBK5969629.1 DUF2283 domain-containing protein [Thiorhodovibrio winogradskyi]WPL14697.1 hypothetical protein Thiosp_04552 [Thiorhodovibrio litoralis]